MATHLNGRVLAARDLRLAAQDAVTAIVSRSSDPSDGMRQA